MTWIYIAGGAAIAVILAKLACVLFAPMGGVAMPGGETDMRQFKLGHEEPKAPRRRWRVTIERD
jgi:hypothetical protein